MRDTEPSMLRIHLGSIRLCIDTASPRSLSNSSHDIYLAVRCIPTFCLDRLIRDQLIEERNNFIADDPLQAENIAFHGLDIE